MGGSSYGGSYSRDVDVTPRAKSLRSASATHSFGGVSKAAEEVLYRTQASKATSPKRKIISEVANPIIIGLDDTGSMGDSAKLIYDKLPMLFGQLRAQGYVEEAQISFGAIGDQGRGSQASVQISDFAADDLLDVRLGELWLEGGGGGNRMESYQLFAHYYNLNCTFNGMKKGFFFIIGDESVYPEATSEEIQAVFGVKSENIPTKGIFKQLQEKLEVCTILIPYSGGDLDSTAEFIERWKKYLPKERVLLLKDPRGVADLILGCVALLNGTRTLDGYVSDMRAENGIRKEAQTEERVLAIRETLIPMWKKIQKNGVTPPKKMGMANLVQPIDDEDV